MSDIVKNDLFDYKNRYIYQSKSGFKFSLDSILIAEYVRLSKTSKKILDLCTGNAPIPLILSTKTSAEIWGFEIQKDIYDLATKSVIENKLSEQIKLINDDVNNIEKYFPGNEFDIIVCNPPYFKYVNDEQLNKEEKKAIARHEKALNLENIFFIVNRFLKDNGVFYMVHRPERIDDIIISASNNKINLKEIQFIATKDDGSISLVLMKFMKHANTGVKFKKIINVSNLVTYQNLFKE